MLSLSRNKPLPVRRQTAGGVVLALVLVMGAILLLLGLSLFQFAGHQHQTVNHLTRGELAHFLAEAGITTSVRAIRDTLGDLTSTGKSGDLHALLTQPKALPDTSLMSFLKDTWNTELKVFAKEVDKTAKIRVEVWLRDFKQTETDPKFWVDPVAKDGWLSIEATGEYRGVSRTLSVRRAIRVANILPPVYSKFTLHVRDADQGKPGRFNLIRNDHGGNVSDGARPIICLNHTAPDDPLQSKSIGDIIAAEKAEDIYLKRGWIWLGGRKTCLNITSGAGSLGEIFHFYDVSNPRSIKSVKFRLPKDFLPPVFSQPVTLPWDKMNTIPRQVSYSFAQTFVLEGFHDQSSRQKTNAMYEGNILSRQEQLRYGAKSSILHLFGKAQKGYQSRTKVFGKVAAAFPRYATLDVTPEEPDVAEMFRKKRPPPVFLLPSVGKLKYDPMKPIKNFDNKQFGAPVVTVGMLFKDYAQYSKVMSRIIEVPYVTSYNTIQDIIARSPRQFPPRSAILREDLGNQMVLTRGQQKIYQGPVACPKAFIVMQSRVQQQLASIKEFWDNFYDKEAKVLKLNRIVRIANSDRKDLFLPPSSIAAPLKVQGGGMIILDQGNLVLRGVQMATPKEALTVVCPKAQTVFFQTPTVNHVNIVAPQAAVSYGARVNLLGNLAVRTIGADSRSQGGTIRFREAQDPLQPSSLLFAKIFLAKKDSYWFE